MRGRTIPGAVAVLATAFAIGYGLSAPSSGDPDHGAPHAIAARGSRPAAALAEVRSVLAAQYVDPVGDQVLHATSVAGAIAALNDPYTRYLAPADLAAERRDLRGDYVGVGVRLGASSDRLGFVVTDLMPDSPAARAGLRRGDVITAIDGAGSASLGVAQAAGRLAGAAGSVVMLVVQGDDGSDHSVRLLRTLVRSDAVSSRLVRRGARRLTVIRIRRFTAGVAAAVRGIVERAPRGPAAGFVLDLRGDPGGLVDEAVGVCSVFLDGGVVAEAEGRHVRPHWLEAAPGGYTHVPLAVAVDHETASSAELVAAALGDRQRAVIVGEPTFGKTAMQELVPLETGGALMVTVSRFRGPAGGDLHLAGYEPSVAAASRLAVGRALDVVAAAP